VVAHARIRGYEILRKVRKEEVPADIPLNKGLRGSYGYLVPPGIDLLELGLIHKAGHYELLPIDADDKPLWDEVTNLIITESQAAEQIEITFAAARALLDLMPDDAADLDIMLQGKYPDFRPSLLFLLGEAAVDTWTELRRGSAPLDEAERLRLQAAVTRRVAAYLGEVAPRCRLDRESLHLVAELPYRRLLARIDTAIAQGDHEDASLRALSRLIVEPRLPLPVEHVLRLLPGVPRLELFFLFVRYATGDIVQGLTDWLQHSPVDSDPHTAEYAVRVLYAVMHFTESTDLARSAVRTLIPRLRCEPATNGARRIKLWMAAFGGDETAVRKIESNWALGKKVRQAMDRWQHALDMKFVDVFATLPERA
jgi:hypothetical protein